MNNNRDFYLGKEFDFKNKKLTDNIIYYDPADLTTHMFVTGMTGSGKTGLCVGLMEEAALQNIPAIVIDPKGDLTNLLLHFPDLLPTDFEPWIDPEAARRENKSPLVMAEETAAMWKNGLADWGLTGEDIRKLQDSAEFAIFTPGSTAGIPVDILSSFSAPDLDWAENQEGLRERIASNITALLGLIGFNDIDPLSSREHILLANIMEHYWSKGQSFDLTELIMQTQSPPFDRLGAFPIDRLFPEKDRFALAMKLNNFLASPSFQTWMQGQSLDIEKMLYSENGKPRQSIFYLAHLSENERMFFVTLLFGAVESWMRKQSGTSGLRALIYFDEILGYLPPVANPPSRPIILRMLKQARAFGVGLVLATQNPVDMDYKALSNAGTWMIGRLQTDQDKERLMDGLQSASGSIDRAEADHLLSNLGKRIFLLHNVHEKGLKLFNTRWAMNYLAGPMTRTQIPALNALVGAGIKKPSSSQRQAADEPKTQPVKSQSSAAEPVITQSVLKPVLPSGIIDYHLPNNLTLQNAAQKANVPLMSGSKMVAIEYHPRLLAQAEIRYLDRKYNVQTMQKKSVLVNDETGRMIRWEDHLVEPIDQDQIERFSLPETGYQQLPVWLADPKTIKILEADFLDWVYRTDNMTIRASQSLKIFAGPEVSEQEFKNQIDQAIKDQLDLEIEKVKSSYEKKITALEQKLEKEERDVEDAKDRLGERRLEEAGTHGEMLIALLSKRKKSISSSLTKRRMTAQAKDKLENEKKDVEFAIENLEAMQKEMDAAIAQLEQEWAAKASDVTEIVITPLKKDIFVELFGVAWVPYYIVEMDGRNQRICAFGSK
ncbi:MAG: DUF87 domain-containing protein [Anaerolineaceae bacterium]|jgi:hypothetical protein|nr:DUF87 domain-containing protein [Anaerolineaceae bacterium]